MTLEEYEALLKRIEGMDPVTMGLTLAREGQTFPPTPPPISTPKPKRKTSAYNRKYKKEFRRIAPQYKMKSGKWKKGGFRKTVKAAHKAVKK